MSAETNRGQTPIFCERHPDEEAALICGSCARRICTICLTLTGEGVRCPDCMARLNAEYANNGAVTPKPEPAYTYSNPRPARCLIQDGPHGQIRERDTGFRSYMKRTPPRYLIEPRYYVLATLAAVVSAVIVGIIWGVLLNAPTLSRIYAAGNTPNRALESLAANLYRDSIHFLPEILVGVLVAEAVARVTQDRRGSRLQLIAGLGVLLACLVAIATLVVRLYLNAGSAFPPIGTVLNDTWNILDLLFKSGGTAIFVFWGLGIAMAVFRLKR